MGEGNQWNQKGGEKGEVGSSENPLRYTYTNVGRRRPTKWPTRAMIKKQKGEVGKTSRRKLRKRARNAPNSQRISLEKEIHM